MSGIFSKCIFFKNTFRKLKMLFPIYSSYIKSMFQYKIIKVADY